MTEPGLDAAFLDFIRAGDRGAHGALHEVYLPMFRSRRRVVDLACGEGVFVELLARAGHEALGVDSDPGCVAAARAVGLTVEQADVFEWLAAQPDASVDGVFNAHLVEHLPFERVLDLYREAHRVLNPGGVLVTVTPNARALFSHLEMFYQHFGHVTFYHPRLLAFFAHVSGFASSDEGENPRLAAPLFGPPDPVAADPAPRVDTGAAPAPRFTRELPGRGGHVGGPWRRLKMGLARLVVLPYLDDLVADLHRSTAAANAERQRLAEAVAAADRRAAETRGALDAALERLDRSFEAYVVSRRRGGGQEGGQAP